MDELSSHSCGHFEAHTAVRFGKGGRVGEIVHSAEKKSEDQVNGFGEGASPIKES